jgi:hypothetical protein
MEERPQALKQSNKHIKTSFTLILECALLIMLVLAGTFSRPVRAMSEEPEQHVFSTWEGFEVDKCASIWLIKRFVDTNAIFRFFPKGETLTTGIPFDTPDAQLRRYHNLSTFESVLARYHMVDPKLLHIGKIVHDIEINIWEKKVMPETVNVQETVNGIIKNAKDNEEVIEQSMKYFDALYIKLATGPESP